ncbi:hypothetical protein [Thalassospira lucentensis]|uniref:hypothetical protein n=1 Tax=Thalassospira lucentensis TaxID=168935 RepID=UPI0039F0C74B
MISNIIFDCDGVLIDSEILSFAVGWIFGLDASPCAGCQNEDNGVWCDDMTDLPNWSQMPLFREECAGF